MIPAADLAAMYGAFTMQATFNSATAPVHFRRGDTEQLLGDPRMMADYVIRYRATDFTTLTRGSTVTIGADTFKVIETPRYTDSGDERIARLSKQ